MLELLACQLGRNDEIPNIELAEKLCENMDSDGVCEIVNGLKSNDQAVANDCIKVLYEIGQKIVFLILLEHLAKCRPKDIPQHAERMAVCIDSGNKEAFICVLQTRMNSLSGAQTRRLLNLMS